MSYIGLFVLLVVSFGAALAMTFLNEIIGSKKRRTDSYQYECGVPLYDKDARPIFKQGYYLLGILLILFDIEAAFLFPWAVVFKEIGAFGLFEALGFLFILGLGFVYAWRKNALKWQL